jgi:hypothetical protein
MWRSLKRFLRNTERRRFLRNIHTALALNLRHEVRTDGLCLRSVCNWLEVEWWARSVHPWDRVLPADQKATLFVEQCLSDTDAVISRLFDQLPSVDVIELRVLASSERTIIAGTALRREFEQLTISSPGMRLKQLGLSYRLAGHHFEALEAGRIPRRAGPDESLATLGSGTLTAPLASNTSAKGQERFISTN